MSYQEAYARYYSALGIPSKMLKDTLWIRYQRMAVPIAPASEGQVLTEEECRGLLSYFRDAVLVRYTDGFSADAVGSDSYSVICKKALHLSDYTSKKRSMINKGLKHCEVRKIDTQHIVSDGYDTFASAFGRYDDSRPPTMTREEFERKASVAGQFPELVEYWGVFCEGKMVGYSENNLYGEIESAYTVIRLDPRYLKCYPAYALIYTMNQHYLNDRSFQYVNDGFRNILHATEFQQFLIDKFGFERAPTRLCIHYHPALATAVKFAYPFRKYLGRLNPRVRSLLQQEELRRQSASLGRR